MKKNLVYISITLLTIFSIIFLNNDRLDATNVFPKGPHFKLMEKLSKEQQEEVKNKVKELWETGASREEIRDTVKKLFEDYGVDFPDEMKGFPGMRGPRHSHGFMRFSDQLSEEQIHTIKEKVESLCDEGASREAVHAEVINTLKEYGVEIPEDYKDFPGRREPRHGRGFMKFSDQLSEDQVNTIKEKVELLREQGASREEIHAEVKNLLEEYGVEVPEDFNAFPRKRGSKPGRELRQFSDQLTDEQRAAIREKAKTMHEQGVHEKKSEKKYKKWFGNSKQMNQILRQIRRQRLPEKI